MAGLNNFSKRAISLLTVLKDLSLLLQMSHLMKVLSLQSRFVPRNGLMIPQIQVSSLGVGVGVMTKLTAT